MNNLDHVICPNCVHEFGAIPENVQHELAFYRNMLKIPPAEWDKTIDRWICIRLGMTVVDKAKRYQSFTIGNLRWSEEGDGLGSLDWWASENGEWVEFPGITKAGSLALLITAMFVEEENAG